MAEQQDNKNPPYRGDRNTEPNRQTGTINSQNNNMEASTPGAVEPTVEGASAAGIGDQAVNDQKLTNFTSNHSADA